jgi:hypothetical protein
MLDITVQAPRISHSSTGLLIEDPEYISGTVELAVAGLLSRDTLR